MVNPSIKKNVILSTAYQILTVITPFITAPYIARVLGADGVGIVSYTESIQTYFSMFAALGTVGYGTREIARVRNDVASRSKLFFEIELLTIFTTTFCLMLWFCWIYANENYRVYYLVWTMTILSVAFDISWLYMGLEQFQYIVYRNAFFRILGIVALFLFVKTHDALAIYIAITAGSALLGNISMWMYLPKLIIRVEWRRLRILPHFKETIIYFIPTIATSIYTVLDKTLLGVFVGSAAENGYYEQTTKIIRISQSLTFAALNSVLEARMSLLFAERKFVEIHDRIKKSIDYILFMGFGVVFGLIGVSDVFVPWFFGPGYDKVIPLLQLMSPIILIIGISNCLGSQYYTPAGLRKTSAKFIIIGSVVNLLLNLILIPYLWSYGAVISSLIAETTISILYLKFCGDYLNIKIIAGRAWKKFVSAVIMFLVIYTIPKFIGTGIVTFIIQVVVGVAVYSCTLFVLRDSFVKTFYTNVVFSRFRNR
ncbi:oligosaccharide flippase family protein [Selenomonas sp.]|jgi:O-antigen/teichoic acid export membrane protein|uniref:oligosaccharide flippase family protein n=1 Tax=Selenomonas sp. TaxID=2053611 RepID=UPI003A102C17